MEPERGFVKDLKSLDNRLSVGWNRDLERFVITYQRPHGEPVPILLVKREDNNGFRWPDRRDLMFIKSGDMENETVRGRMNKISHYMEQSRRRQRERTRQEIRDMTKDSKIQLGNALQRMGGSGKGNSAFRRVDLRKRGKTVDELKNAVNDNWHAA